ncbi:hypothetical protein Tco_0605236 [Tanacetum coccineum]
MVTRLDVPSRVGMNPQRFPEADHSHGCVIDGLITIPDDHQLNGEVEIPIVVTTNTTSDTQKESTPHLKKAAYNNVLLFLFFQLWHRFKCQEAFDTFSNVAATEHMGSRHAENQGE